MPSPSTFLSFPLDPSPALLLPWPPSSSHPPLRLVLSSSARPAVQPFRSQVSSETSMLVMGVAGYIGRFVVHELLRWVHPMVAIARSQSGLHGCNGPDEVVANLTPFRVVFSDVTEAGMLFAELSTIASVSMLAANVHTRVNRSH
uniref:NAD-dependent epimerase/dehydratase domain-containing protein n=1 Tax=Oryza barthii TaxID=65489 RepID=A0A0D3HC00_9ORYZ